MIIFTWQSLLVVLKRLECNMMGMIRKIGLVVFLVIILASACSPQTSPEPTPRPTATRPAPTATAEPEPKPEPEPEPEPEAWWQDIVYYEIFVRSFKDSTGDGIGDFQGIIQQLDYLNDGDPQTHTDLGIQGIWLMPINPSPSYHGYDVTDYYAVNPDYGNMDDFKELLAEAEKRGIKIIIDLVINHTSTEHPWFQAAQDPASDFHDWYVWSEEHPQVPGPWFQNAWHRNRVNNLYYYGVFWGGMPDLNFDNPAVSEEMMSISKFWLEEVGVHGFRVDAARYLYADGISQQDTKETITWFEDWRAFYKAINPWAFTVGEVWTDLQVTARYSDGMDSLFMFNLAEDIKNGIYVPNPRRIINSYLDILTFFPDGNFSTFLSNHDQQRVMSFFEGDVNKARVAAFVYLTGPGVPFIYYGEEIGMSGNKPDELLRTPMQWSDDPGAGFTSGTPWQPPNQDYAQINVAAQIADPESLLNNYRTLVHLRNQYAALRTGTYLPLTSTCQQLYPILRIEDEQALIVLANLSRRELEGCTISIEESPLTGQFAAELLFGEGAFSDFSFTGDGGLVDYPLPDIIQPFQAFILQLNQP